jgi:exopolyphosphatase / guanosine-5'-triphosphate,3'-diphosphate pyrophosphatase
VAVVDVGANTLRLLVAEPRGVSLDLVHEERHRTLLGEDVERLGRLTTEKIERSAQAARREVRRARKLGATQVEVVVTSPWRNAANGSALVKALERAVDFRVRPLSPEEEAELAYSGALALTPVAVEPVGVCDVGGGSTQLAIGSSAGPAWLRSVELGSLRLTERCLRSDPPVRRELDEARHQAAAAVGALAPPVPPVGLATGGTARALRRMGVEQLDPEGLEEALEELSRLRTLERAKRARVDLARAHTLPAGTIILAAVQALLQTPMRVADGGLREGVCIGLLSSMAASA